MTQDEYRLLQKVKTILRRLKRAGKIVDYSLSLSEKTIAIKFEPKPFWRIFSITGFLRKYREETLEQQDEYKVHRPRRQNRNRRRSGNSKVRSAV